MLRRWLHGTFWFKALAVGLVVAGLSEKSAALISAAVAAWVVAVNIRDGLHEQYWESPMAQAARLWEDVVWGHATWVNPETPDQGVQRLSGPYRLPQAVPEDKYQAFSDPPVVTEQRAPHLLDTH